MGSNKKVELNQIFARRMRDFRDRVGWTQKELADKLGVSSNWISSLEQGDRNPSPSIEKFLELLESSPLYQQRSQSQSLATPLPDALVPAAPFELKEIIAPAPRGRLIKVASWAQAGEATDYEQIAASWQEEVATNCTDADAVGVQLRGDSMLPNYHEGDVVIMMPSREPRTGCLVVARLRDEGVVFKLYSEAVRGVIRLSSYNPAYPAIERRRDDFQWICPVYETNRNVWR